MIYPWIGYAHELLKNITGETLTVAPPWIQAIQIAAETITTAPELQEQVMICLKMYPPCADKALTAFCTLCAIFEYYEAGHAILNDTIRHDVFESWLNAQSPCGANLPHTSDMVEWIQTFNPILTIDEPKCQTILSGSQNDISNAFCPNTSSVPSHPHILKSAPILVHVRQGLMTPRLFAVQAEITQHLRHRLEQPTFPMPQMATDDMQTMSFANGKKDNLHTAQVKAIQTALSHALTVITGGPGTGKTSIIQKILELCVHKLHIAPVRILLSAPTGKAARRMGEAISIENIATPQTLHRLLQLKPNGLSRFHAQSPIPADVIIIDELSMLGFDLAVTLLQAVSPQTRLILIGDPEQLPPVDSGNLLEALVHPTKATMTDGLADKLAQICVHLTHNYRIKAQNKDLPNNILTIQSAVMLPDKSQTTFQQLLRKTPDTFAFEHFEYCDDMTQTQRALDIWANQIEKSWLQNAQNPNAIPLQAILRHKYTVQNSQLTIQEENLLESVFNHLERFRLLTPMNRTAFGATQFNAYLMHKLGLTPTHRSSQLPIGCLALLTQNSYIIHHFNGETGLVIQDTQHHKYIAFPAAEPNDTPHKFDLFSLDIIPQTIPAFAMSVHKSQGSQYEHVLIILPPNPSPLLTPNMLYTAISRAKWSAALMASPETLQSCLR